MRIAETMSNWLRKIERDQNIQGLDQLEDTLQAERGRRWFKRQDLTPTLTTGYYDQATEKFVLGSPTEEFVEDINGIATQLIAFINTGNSVDGSLIVTDTAVTTGAAAATLTVAAGHVYKVVSASTKNDTRATTATLVLTPNGGTAANLVDTAAGTYAQSYQVTMLGGGDYNAGATAVMSNCGCNGALWMQAGDTLVITQGSYQGGDTVEHNFVYEDYTL